MRKVLSLLVVIIAAISVSAQSEQDLRQYFEGKTVSLKIDIPATRDGVNIYPERDNPLDYSEYSTRLKRYGTSAHRGDEITVTKISVKDKVIEVQTSRGEYGKTGSEKGTAFNIHFNLVDPTLLPPDAVVVALRRYVDFSGIDDSDEAASYLEPTSYSFPADDFKPGVLQVGPRTTYLKEGLSAEEVVRLLGQPSAVYETSVDDIVVTTYEFPRGEGRVLIAEFVKSMLIRSTMETRAQVARAGR
jgi:hypothetical protein